MSDTRLRKKYFGADQIDGSKFKLLQDQAIRGTNSLGQEVELIKIGLGDKAFVAGQEIAFKAELVSEKERIDAILSAADADKDTFVEIVQLINSIDTTNDLAFAGYVLSNNAALAQEVLDRQSGDSSLQSSLSQEVLDRQSADASTLQDSKDYADQKDLLLSQDISDIDAALIQEVLDRQSGDSALQSSISQEVIDRQSADASTLQASKDYSDQQGLLLSQDIDALDVYAQDIRTDVDSLDVYAQDIRSDLDSVETRVSSLEAKGFSKGMVVVGTELAFVDLDRVYSMMLSTSVGRLAIHEGEDYTVSEVAGKTRLTFIGSLLSPGGLEAVEQGDKIYFSGTY